MTIKELKELIAELPDDVRVCAYYHSMDIDIGLVKEDWEYDEKQNKLTVEV